MKQGWECRMKDAGCWNTAGRVRAAVVSGICLFASPVPGLVRFARFLLFGRMFCAL